MSLRSSSSTFDSNFFFHVQQLNNTMKRLLLLVLVVLGLHTLEEKSEIQFKSSCRSTESKEFDGICLRPSFLLLILYDSEKSRNPAGTSGHSDITRDAAKRSNHTDWSDFTPGNKIWNEIMRSHVVFVDEVLEARSHLSLFVWMWYRRTCFLPLGHFFVFL